MINLLFVLSWIITSFVLIYFVSHAWYFIILFILAGLAVGVILVLLFTLFMIGLYPHKNVHSHFKHYFTRSIARFTNFWGTRVSVKVTGKENIPKDGPLVVYTNHKSLNDPFILLQVFNRNLAFTPKKTLYKSWALRTWFDSIGCLPIDRENDRETAKSMIKAIKDVKAGLAIAVFPEGGIKSRDDDQMKDIKAGAYKLATKSNAIILPISIIGNSSLSKNWPFKITKTKVIIHKPITPDEYKDLTTLEIGEKVFKIINEGLL